MMLVMRMTIFLLIATLTTLSAKVTSQPISFSGKNVPMQEVFKAIEKQTGFVIFCNYDLLKSANRVTINVKNIPLMDFLRELFEDQPLSFMVENSTIAITRKLPVIKKFVTPLPIDPPITVKGRVVNEKGEPVIATVLVKGTKQGVATDVDGSFTLNNVPDDAVLVISGISITSTEFPVKGKTALVIHVTSQISSMSEIVITGYSSERKSDITGSVTVVDVDNVKAVPVSDPSQALQGQASGLNVITSGAPGGRTDIFIRGVTSFGNSEPLIIIDGIQGDLSNLNVNDIASIQVLKDAGAASIYGVRGSNGVIVVTTKKGKSGDPVFTFDSYYGIQLPKSGNVFNLMSPTDYAQLLKTVNPGTILFGNGLPEYTYAGPGIAGAANAGDPAVDPSKYNFDPMEPENDYLIQKVNRGGTDWFHELFKPAPTQSHTITASGGNDKSVYLFSLGYLNQQGTLIESFLERYSVRLNSEFKLGKHVKIGENAYLYYKRNPGFSNLDDNNEISYAYRIMSMIPVRDIMGNYGGTWLGPELGSVGNPVATRERSRMEKNNFWNMSGNIYAEVNFLKNFTLRTTFGGRVDNQYSYNFNHNKYEDKEQHNNYNSFNENALYNSSYTWTNTASYHQQIDKHSIKLLVGSEAIKNSGRAVGGSSEKFFSTSPDYLVLNNGTLNVSNYSSSYVNTLFSLFGRLDYSYDDKYLLGATLRRDGSSVFGSDMRYGLFPSFSAGWKISSENFMEHVNFVNLLKLRGSYGILGSQANINASNAFSLYNSGFGTSYYDIGGTGSTRQGFYQSNIGNRKTSWEEDVVTNIGLDATILDNKLDLSIEWYKKSIDGLLFPLPLPASVGGAAPPTVNIGDIQNKGWDISVAYRGKFNKEVTYNIGVNITTYKNEVVSIPDPGYFDVANSRIGNLVRNQEGHSVGSFFGYEVIGLFRDENDVASSPAQTDAAPGRFKYQDVNGDKAITPEDRIFFGDPNPDFTYGLNLGLSFRRFDISGIFYGSQGNDVVNFVRYFTEFFGSAEGRSKSNLLKEAWTPANPDAKIPVVEYANSFSTNGTFNSYLKEDGSFFKLRTLTVGYTPDLALLHKLGIKTFRIYGQAVNLFTLTKYKGLDPELTGSIGGANSSSSFGIDYGNYPNNQKNFILGAKLTF